MTLRATDGHRAVVGRGQGRRGGGGPQLTHALGIKQERPYAIDQALLVVPQNAIDIELCLRLTNGKPRVAGQAGASAKKMADKRTLDRRK